MRQSLVVSTLCLGLLAAAPPAARRAEIVEQYRAARARDDGRTVASILAKDARIWFGRREGEGRALETGGRGPWAEWDEFFRSESSLDAIEAIEGGIRTTVRETNDWYRLVEREPTPYWIDYFFDEHDRIEGILVHGIPGVEKAPDRLAEFRSWAEANRPGLLDTLMPDGEIDPSKFELWKELLLAWRRDAGLGDVLSPR